MFLVLVVPSPLNLPDKLLKVLYVDEVNKKKKPIKSTVTDLDNLLDDELIDDDSAIKDAEDVLRTISEK